MISYLSRTNANYELLTFNSFNLSEHILHPLFHTTYVILRLHTKQYILINHTSPFPSFDIIHKYHSTSPAKHLQNVPWVCLVFSPRLKAPSVTVVTQDRKYGVLCEVTGHQS